MGYIKLEILKKIQEVPSRLKQYLDINHESQTIAIQLQDAPTNLSQYISEITEYWRENETFSILRTWTDELWPVYRSRGEVACTIERSAAGLFGVNRYGVHLTGYVRCPEDTYGMKIWVATRSASKSTFPSMLDNTVAGGLMAGEEPFDCIVREADEEASLPSSLVRNSASPAGTITYVYVTDERAGGESGLIYPECQWVYDLEIPGDVVPVPKDGEAESFSLYTIGEIRSLLEEGRFKPNCALVMIDFFIRHGILNTMNESHLQDICHHLHRKLPFPGPHEEYP